MKSSVMRTFARASAGMLGMVVLTSAIAACGGSSSHSATTKSTAVPSSTTTTSATSPAAASASPTTATNPTATAGAVHATLHGANHKPIAGKPWSYSVHVTNADGHPLSGTVETDFVVAGIGVVGKETPALHKLKHGVLNDNVTFPAEATGHPITLVTVVHTPPGSVALGWPVTVTK